MGNAASLCPGSCISANGAPNGNPGADGMASVIAHELVETVSDPRMDGYYFESGDENADYCAWKFGTTTTTASGQKTNMRLGSRDFLIQQVHCTLHTAHTACLSATCSGLGGQVCRGKARVCQWGRGCSGGPWCKSARTV